MTLPLPLAGVRVLAVEQYGAGPFGTQYLSDLGADIIKVENPKEGDVGRHVGPYFVDGAQDSAASLFFQSNNRAKRSLTLDLKSAEGQRVFRLLVKNADAVCHNLRGDVPGKLKLTYDDLKTANPRIVCAHLTAYGRDNERATWPGYDYLMQAEAGYLSLTGEPDGPPARMGLSIVDMMTGLSMSYGLVAAVLSARTTGQGRDVDVTLFDTALYNLSYVAHWYLAAGHNERRRPRSAHPSLVPCQLVKTKDGWIFLMCNKEKFWGRLCEIISRPEWASDPRFATFKDRFERRDEVSDMLDQALAARTTDDWIDRFAGQVPAAPLRDVAGALENPFVRRRGRIRTQKRPDGKTVQLLASPIQMAGMAYPEATAPEHGQHTDEILREAGLATNEITALRKAGVI
ncbi:MAG: CoA transferase [Alphaproteobacteria bacterium]|nr:CoA transferase [Alphaproteobacteria bacterium]